VEKNTSGKLGFRLLKKIINFTSTSKDHPFHAKYKPNVKIFLKDLQFTKAEMIFALNYLKRQNSEYLESITIPEEWDIDSNISCLEIFKVFLKKQCKIGLYQTVLENPNNYYWCHKRDLLNAYNQYLGGLEILSVTMTALTRFVNALDYISIKTRRINGKPIRIIAGLRINP